MGNLAKLSGRRRADAPGGRKQICEVGKTGFDRFQLLTQAVIDSIGHFGRIVLIIGLVMGRDFPGQPLVFGSGFLGSEDLDILQCAHRLGSCANRGASLGVHRHQRIRLRPCGISDFCA